MVDDELQVVTVACHKESDDVKPGTLASIIRQSKLARELFR
jgi:predicted RNA binding protein YcfA (HicA-like mRNA interferase family)